MHVRMNADALPQRSLPKVNQANRASPGKGLNTSHPGQQPGCTGMAHGESGAARDHREQNFGVRAESGGCLRRVQHSSEEQHPLRSLKQVTARQPPSNAIILHRHGVLGEESLGVLQRGCGQRKQLCPGIAAQPGSCRCSRQKF